MQEIKHIVHIEDDQDILEITKLSLEIIGGFELQQYALGCDAIRDARNIKTDLLLLDLMMPTVNGVETLRRLRLSEHLNQTPAIFVTAKNLQNCDVQTELGDGVIGVIEKPFEVVQLPNTIRELWNSYIAKMTDNPPNPLSDQSLRPNP